MAKKTDNHDPRAKLDLRRYFLRKYHVDDPARVLDCCQGSGILWNRLREEFPVASYWGLDVKPKKGRLKLDSVRVLAQPGWDQNVVDCDTYGAPWDHWLALLPNVTKPLTVFLTDGWCNVTAMTCHGFVRSALGLPCAVPQVLAAQVNKAIGPLYALAESARFGVTIIEAVEHKNTHNTRYIGLRIRPQRLVPERDVSYNTVASGADTPERPKHTRLKGA